MNTLQHSSPITIKVTRIALALLLLAVIGGQIVTVISAQSMVESYPEFADLQSPLVTVAITFGICIELVLVITGILIGYTRDGRIFDPLALRLVDTMTVTFAVATILVAATVFLIPGPPILGLLLLGSALVGAIFTLVLLVLRSLLRRAAFMWVELDEVI